MYTKEVHVHTHRRLAAVTFSLPLVFYFLRILVLGIKPRALCMLGKHCTREPHPSPSLLLHIRSILLHSIEVAGREFSTNKTIPVCKLESQAR